MDDPSRAHLDIWEKSHTSDYTRGFESTVRKHKYKPGFMELWLPYSHLYWGVMDGKVSDHSKYIRAVRGDEERQLNLLDADIVAAKKVLKDLQVSRAGFLDNVFKKATKPDDTSIPSLIEETGGTVRFK